MTFYRRSTLFSFLFSRSSGRMTPADKLSLHIYTSPKTRLFPISLTPSSLLTHYFHLQVCRQQTIKNFIPEKATHDDLIRAREGIRTPIRRYLERSRLCSSRLLCSRLRSHSATLANNRLRDPLETTVTRQKERQKDMTELNRNSWDWFKKITIYMNKKVITC